jgi:hypothetical protein
MKPERFLAARRAKIVHVLDYKFSEKMGEFQGKGK